MYFLGKFIQAPPFAWYLNIFLNLLHHRAREYVYFLVFKYRPLDVFIVLFYLIFLCFRFFLFLFIFVLLISGSRPLLSGSGSDAARIFQLHKKRQRRRAVVEKANLQGYRPLRRAHSRVFQVRGIFAAIGVGKKCG